LTAREGQVRPGGVADGSVVPAKSGNADGGKGPWFRTSVESSDSREIGDEPTTSGRTGWETMDGTAYQSEGGTGLPLLRAVRQVVPDGRAGMGLQALSRQQGDSGSGPSDVRGHRGVWGRALAAGTGGGTPKQDVPTPSGAEGMDSEGGRQTATVGHTDDPRPRGANGSHARTRSDLRGGLAARATRLPTWEERSGSDQGSPEAAGCGL